MKANGLDVDCSYVKDLNPASMKGYDCLIAGSPTQMWKPTGTMMRFLGGFATGEFSGKLAAAFDTQYEGRFTGSAAKGIEKQLKRLGFKIISAPLIAYVEGKPSAVLLKEGELDKVTRYGEQIAKLLVR